MDAEKVIEEAERWAKNVSESPGNGTAGEDLYGAKLLISLAAALRETMARADGATLEALNLKQRQRALELVSADAIRKNDELAACLRSANALVDAMRKERDDLAAANLAANKRIEALEHERDAARAELARLTTPRPIAEAPKDGTWIVGFWDDAPPKVIRRWAEQWRDYMGASVAWRGLTHFLLLPVLP